MPVCGTLGFFETDVAVGGLVPDFTLGGGALASVGESGVVVAVVAQAGLVQVVEEDVAAVFAASDGVPRVRTVGTGAIFAVAFTATTDRDAFGHAVGPQEVLVGATLAGVVGVGSGVGGLPVERGGASAAVQGRVAVNEGGVAGAFPVRRARLLEALVHTVAGVAIVANAGVAGSQVSQAGGEFAVRVFVAVAASFGQAEVDAFSRGAVGVIPRADVGAVNFGQIDGSGTVEEVAVRGVGQLAGRTRRGTHRTDVSFASGLRIIDLPLAGTSGLDDAADLAGGKFLFGADDGASDQGILLGVADPDLGGTGLEAKHGIVDEAVVFGLTGQEVEGIVGDGLVPYLVGIRPTQRDGIGDGEELENQRIDGQDRVFFSF